MKFQPGHKFAKGGKRPGAGHPTNEATLRKAIKAEVVREIIEDNALKLVNAYVKRALSGKADKVLMDAIAKMLPAAKQELELSGGLKIVKVDAFDPSKE